MSTTSTQSQLQVDAPSLRTNLRGLFKTMRPRQWVKSVIVYAALVFDGKLLVLNLFLQDYGRLFRLLPHLQQRLHS
jgi:hypothetical protein